MTRVHASVRKWLMIAVDSFTRTGCRVSGLAIASVCVVALHAPFASAAETDCLEDGGTRLCSAPTLSPWRYTACVNSNYNATIIASGVCQQQHPGPWTTEGQMLGYVACMPVQDQQNACSATASLSGWHSPGQSTTTGLCGTYTVVETNGSETRNYSYVAVDAIYKSAGGQCDAPGGYYTTIATRNRSWTCPAGYTTTTVNGVLKCKMNDRAPAAPCASCCEDTYGGKCAGNPIQIGSWEKYQREVDYQGSALNFTRTFYSYGGFVPPTGQAVIPNALGKRWTHTYDRRIYAYTGNAYVMAVALRPMGEVRYFGSNGREKLKLGPSALLAPIYAGGALTGWRLTTTDNEFEDYDANGNLLSITSRGAIQTLSYSDANTSPAIAPFPGLLIQVEDHAGRQLHFEYDAAGRLIKMIDPAGGEYVYAYDEASSILQTGEAPAGDLTSVTYPATGLGISKRVYHYNEAAYFTPVSADGGLTYPHLLTGITGEDGIRHSRYWYNNTNKAHRTQGAGGFDRYAFSFTTQFVAQMVNPLGTAEKYQHDIIAGTTKLQSITLPCQSNGCSGNKTSSFFTTRPPAF